MVSGGIGGIDAIKAREKKHLRISDARKQGFQSLDARSKRIISCDSIIHHAGVVRITTLITRTHKPSEPKRIKKKQIITILIIKLELK